MKCPTDAAVLQMSERHGIEIDYCPECRGVWLDRGELDKIVERASAELSDARDGTSPRAGGDHRDESRYRDDRDRERHRHDRYDDDDDGGQRRGKKRKSSFLGDLFEFGG